MSHIWSQTLAAISIVVKIFSYYGMYHYLTPFVDKHYLIT